MKRNNIRRQSRRFQINTAGCSINNGVPFLNNISAWFASRYNSTLGEIPDQRGTNTRTLYPLQYMTGGTLTHTSIVGTETVTSHGGTGTIVVTAGTLTITGTVWSILLSNGSLYEFGNSTVGVAWDVSDNERHAVLTGVTCGTTLAVGGGSDWLNQRGFFEYTGIPLNPQYSDGNLVFLYQEKWGSQGIYMYGMEAQ